MIFRLVLLSLPLNKYLVSCLSFMNQVIILPLNRSMYRIHRTIQKYKTTVSFDAMFVPVTNSDKEGHELKD